MGAIAYLLTCRCHGTWLPGDERGWVDAAHNVYGTPMLEGDAGLEEVIREGSGIEGRELDAQDRAVVQRAMEDHCAHRGWVLRAIKVRTNHAHMVVAAPGYRAEIVLGQLKGWATRRLREAGLRGAEEDVWAREGSTRHLFSERGVAVAVDYVMNRQGGELR